MTQSTTAPTASENLPHRGNRRILMVGATGFLRAKIQRQLEQDDTVTVRAMSRRGADVPVLQDGKIRVGCDQAGAMVRPPPSTRLAGG